MLTRSQWRPTIGTGAPMRLPASGAVIHHTVMEPTGDPAADMRAIEQVGRARFGLFSYCYIIHPGGIIAEGAGLTVGAHTSGLNSSHIGVAWHGNYDATPAPAEMVAATVELLATLAARGELRPGWTLTPHRAHKATACPGRYLAPLVPAIHAQAARPPTPKDPPMDAAAEARIRTAVAELVELALPFAIRASATSHGMTAGQVYIIAPGAEPVPVGRATLDALYYVGAIRRDPDNQPPTSNPASWADLFRK